MRKWNYNLLAMVNYHIASKFQKPISSEFPILRILFDFRTILTIMRLLRVAQHLLIVKGKHLEHCALFCRQSTGEQLVHL
jgi:hypothetical protein